MGAAIELDTSELEKLAEKMNSFMLSGGDTSGLLRDLGMVLEENTKTRIQPTKLNPAGNKWDPWKESTDRYMKEHFPKASLLWRNPAEGLFNSIESQVNGSDSVIVGSSKEYAKYLQYGTRKMVAREFLGIGTDDIEELQNTVVEFMRRHVS